MRWGVFEETTDAKDFHFGRVHVIPCTRFGTVMEPHEATLACQCKPRIDDREVLLAIHHHPDTWQVPC